MSLSSWNYQGLEAPMVTSELKDLIRSHKLAIIFLMETRAHEERVKKTKDI